MSKILVETEVSTEGIEEGIKEIERETSNLKDIELDIDTDEVEKTTSHLKLAGKYAKALALAIKDTFLGNSEEVEEIPDALEKADGFASSLKDTLHNIFDNRKKTWDDWLSSDAFEDDDNGQPFIKSYDKQIEFLETKIATLKEGLQEADNEHYKYTKSEILEIEQEIEKLNNQLATLRARKAKLAETPLDNNETKEVNEQLQEVNNNINKASNNMGTQLGKAVTSVSRKILRMGMLMLGIRSVTSLLMQSFQRVVKKHPQMQQAIEKVKAMIDVLVDRIVTMIEPLLPKIIPLVEKVLTLIFQIAEALDKTVVPVLTNVVIKAIEWIIDAFGWILNAILKIMGIDITKETSKFVSDLKSAKGEAKEIKKTLMGFDEMNILNDDGSTGTIGSINNQLKETNKNSKKTKNNITKLDVGDYHIEADIPEIIEKGLEEHLELTGEKLDFILGGGLIPTIIRIFKKNNSGGIVGDFEKIVANQYLTEQATKSTNKEFKKFAKYLQTDKNASKQFTTTYKDGMYEITTSTGEVFKVTEKEFEILQKYLKAYGNSLLQAGDFGKMVIQTLGETATKTKKTFTDIGNSITNGGKTFSDEVNKLLNGTESKTTKTKDNINASFGNIGTSIINVLGNVDNKANETKNKLTTSFNGVGTTIKNSASSFADSVKKSLNIIPTESENSVRNTIKNFDKLPPAVQKKLITVHDEAVKWSGSIGDGVGKTLVGGVNAILPKIEKTINEGISSINSLMSNFGNSALMGAYALSGAVKKIPKLKLPLIKLAKGGIINQPGRGVYVGGAVAGERGREGILPLDDTAQMQLLGREIAKNIVINLDNKINVDGRQIARSVTKVMGDMNFASNGGVI